MPIRGGVSIGGGASGVCAVRTGKQGSLEAAKGRWIDTADALSSRPWCRAYWAFCEDARACQARRDGHTEGGVRGEGMCAIED